MSIASTFRAQMDVALGSADSTAGQEPDARRTALYKALDAADLLLIPRAMWGQVAALAFSERQMHVILDSGVDIEVPPDQDAVRVEDLVHIMPVDDLREHETSVDCWCGPSRDAEDSSIVLHNSLDGREKFEGVALQ